MSIIEQINAIETKMNPRFTVPVEMIPIAEDWKVGEDYKIEMNVCQKEMREVDSGKKMVTFEIKEMTSDQVVQKPSLENRVKEIEDNFETA